MRASLRALGDRLVAGASQLLPSSCALCGGAAAQALCEPCQAQFFSHEAVRCPCCALPVAAPNVCGACLHTAPAFDDTIVAADYAAPVDQLILMLKFGGKLALAPQFAGLLRDALIRRTQRIALPTCLTAVPLSANRLRQRGFNQALEIARPLARSLGIPLVPRLLERSRETLAQAELAIDARRRNVGGAFIVGAAWLDAVKGQHVGVVDDVITTGATLQEIAATLKRFGAARVTNLVVARTLPR